MTFPRIKPLGWALYETLTSAQMTQLDVNASKGTDSTYVKDYASGLWFPTAAAVVSTSRRASHIYIPKANAWLEIGFDGSSVPGCNRRVGNGSVYSSTTYPAGLLTGFATSANVAYDGNDIVVQGDAVSSGSSPCFRRTTVSGDFDVWTSRSASAAQGTVPACSGLIWHPATSLFVASYFIPTSTSIDTSPDGITFTNKTLPDSVARGPLATNGTMIVCLQTSSANTCISSTDANTWTVRTLPFTAAWVDVCWSQKLGLFVAVSNDGLVVTSPDGITWTYASPTYPPGYSTVNGFIGIRDLAGMLIATFTNSTVSGARKGVMFSIDAGASWRPLLVGDSSTPVGLAVSANQCAWANGAFSYYSNCLSI